MLQKRPAFLADSYLGELPEEAFDVLVLGLDINIHLKSSKSAANQCQNGPTCPKKSKRKVEKRLKHEKIA